MENSALGLIGGGDRTNIKEDLNNARKLVAMVRDMNISLDEIFEYYSKDLDKTAKDVEREIREVVAEHMSTTIEALADFYDSIDQFIEEKKEGL